MPKAVAYYPECLRFAGEKFHLSRQDWDDYYFLVSRVAKSHSGMTVEEHTRITRDFLIKRGYLSEYH